MTNTAYYAEKDTILNASRTETAHGYHQPNGPAVMPTIQLEKDLDEIYVSSTHGTADIHHVNHSDEEFADYLVFNDSKTRGRSVSQEFRPYKFCEKETKLDSEMPI